MRNYSEKPHVKLPKTLHFFPRPRAGGTKALPKEAQVQSQEPEELLKSYIHYKWPIPGMTHALKKGKVE